MLEFLIDSIFVLFERHIFLQIMGIPMGKTVPFSLLIFSFTPMRQSLHKNTTNIAEDKMTASQSGILMMSTNNPNFASWIPYSSASFLDMYLEIYSNCPLFVRFYEQRDDFNLPLYFFFNLREIYQPPPRMEFKFNIS